MFSVPILTFLGVPITSANATIRVALLFQNVFAVGGFKSKGVELPRTYSLYLGFSSFFGGVIGAILASKIQDEIFNKIFVVVMIFSVVMIIVDPFKSNGIEKLDFKSQLVGVICFFFIEQLAVIVYCSLVREPIFFFIYGRVI